MAPQAPDTQAKTEINAIAGTLFQQLQDRVGDGPFFTLREIASTWPSDSPDTYRIAYLSVPNAPDGFGMYCVKSACPITRPISLSGITYPDNFPAVEGSPDFKAFIETFAIITLIKYGRKDRVEKASERHGSEFMAGAAVPLCSSYFKARGLLPSLVNEAYERFLPSIHSTPHSMASVIVHRSEVIYATTKLMKEWIKNFWGIVQVRRDGNVVFATGDREAMVRKFVGFAEDSEDEEVQEDDVFQKAMTEADAAESQALGNTIGADSRALGTQIEQY